MNLLKIFRNIYYYLKKIVFFHSRIKAGIPGTRDPHCAIFNPLKVEFDAFPGEGVALSLVQGGTAYNNKQREVVLESGLEQLEKSTGEMIIWLERLLKYVNEASFIAVTAF